ncbi:unnamed protein product [Cyprideis torosa]|uniref:Uncharacterized protein n=1 Tax=Cyprideis torosa TaxID=163714 RepID=A0A7R8WCZ9_9CRUS|nr:unnamed protein product [Cyprideis torosa]CAG0892582.1 unnamed protein product [Cyprideis torosa]
MALASLGRVLLNSVKSGGFSHNSAGPFVALQRNLHLTSPNADEGWLSKLNLVRKIEPSKEAHSSLLSDKEVIYELQTHDVKPSYMDDYIENYQKYVDLISHRGSTINKELIGSWIVGVGDLDQCLHLWRYSKGWVGADEANRLLREDKDYIQLKKERTPFLRSRRCQYLLAFSFWPPVQKREGNNVYEIRSYILKAGTMIEWGNNWARGIHYRKNASQPYGGFFSQIGQLYQVHHIWVYESLAHRKWARENAWRSPGWDECVAYTVPLIQEMESRIMLPTPFSPTR